MGKNDLFFSIDTCTQAAQVFHMQLSCQDSCIYELIGFSALTHHLQFYRTPFALQSTEVQKFSLWDCSSQKYNDLPMISYADHLFCGELLVPYFTILGFHINHGPLGSCILGYSLKGRLIRLIYTSFSTLKFGICFSQQKNK